MQNHTNLIDYLHNSRKFHTFATHYQDSSFLNENPYLDDYETK